VRWGNGPGSVGLSRNNLATGFKNGLAWSVVFGLCALLLLGVLYFSGRSIMKLFLSPVEKTAFSVFLLYIVGGLISPVAEEIFFRGIIYGYLRRWGAILAILGSATFFSMAHLLTSGVTAVQIIGGLVFAVAYEREKNLLVPITIHVLGNTAIFTLSIFLVP
jgi:membrane protease YdiL (CAAX protease family)